jgi:uncharacterized protein (DUF1501 family)
MTDASRRDFLRHTLSTGAAFGLLPRCLWASQDPQAPANTTANATASAAKQAAASAVIHVHLDGGLSHLDSFDPKPDAPLEVRGPFGSLRSAIGEPFGELVPQLAKVADKLVVVRSMTHTEADHDRGQHSVLTGYQPNPALAYPSLGAVVAQQLGGRNDLPPYVCIPASNRHLGTGYLSSSHAPFAVGGNPAARDFQVRDLTPPKDVDAARAERRRALQQRLDAGFAAMADADAVRAIESYYRQAYALIESKSARAAFDLAAEPDATKDRYGRRPLGMGCLLARRLVAAGVRYVVVGRGGFDNHADLQNTLPPNLGDVDQAVAALLADLDAQGLLASTMVLLTTEFGRTPRLNADAGRDHWPRVFSALVAGGGSKRGMVFGSSNASGAEPASDPVRPADLAATVFTQLGIDPTQRLLAPGNRPIDLVREGRVLREILA